MTLVVTDAVVLHAFDYLESSRVLRLATREHGVQSVLARGARRSQKRFGSGLDLFAEGQAHYHARAGRELHTLATFDVGRARLALGLDLERFGAAAAVAELVLRFARDEETPAWYDELIGALDAIAAAPAGGVRTAGLGGAWRLVAALGFAPAVDGCAGCHDPVDPDDTVVFSHPAGGALCAVCAGAGGGRRRLPPEARARLRGWLTGTRGVDDLAPLDPASARAHLRLLREFLHEHLADGRPLRALASWEGDRWEGAARAAGGAAPGSDGGGAAP